VKVLIIKFQASEEKELLFINNTMECIELPFYMQYKSFETVILLNNIHTYYININFYFTQNVFL
jgi:hypothetical protein